MRRINTILAEEKWRLIWVIILVLSEKSFVYISFLL